MSSPHRLGLAFVTLLCLSGLAAADVVYTVSVEKDAKRLLVNMEIPVQAGSTHVVVQMPRWAPGSYRYQDFGLKVSDIKAVDHEGRGMSVTQVDPHTWRIGVPGRGHVAVSYALPATIEDDVTHWSGPATYMYIAGRKEEACRLKVNAPAGWRVAVGLNPARGSENSYMASDYDVLADNPVTLGKYLEDTYTVQGKPHIIALRGATKDEVDRERLKKVCQFVTESQAHFFKGPPYDRYVWHFVTMDSRDGAWGLEHLSSTQIGLATGMGPGAVGVISHEFFHLWNVKRIRSKALGPFNYQELPQTGALWFLEGTTDYYAHLLLRRYGWTEDPRWHEVVARNIRAVKRNENRLKTSAYEASYRVRDANSGRGNSQGYNVNYYDTGFVLGLMLDIELRSRTAGRRSLDDVMLALYNITKGGKPGFEEGEIRRQLIRFGGQEMGPIYDKWVTQPGELPVEEQLAKVGLALVEKEEPYAEVGFNPSFSREKGAFEVRSVKAPAEGALKEGDLIVAVEGQALSGLSNRRAQDIAHERFTKAAVEQPVQLSVKRGEETLSVTVTPTPATRKIWTLEAVKEPTPEAQRIREAWLALPSGWRKPAI